MLCGWNRGLATLGLPCSTSRRGLGRVVAMSRSSQARSLPVLAVDIGGTKILAALVATEGTVLAREWCLTEAAQGPRSVTARVLMAIDRLLVAAGLQPERLHSISLAAAGGIDSARGVVTLSPSLPGWSDIPLRDIVAERFGVKALLINDASAAAVGEHHFGAGGGASSLVYITVSTGIGGGIILEDRLYTGPSGSAGEIGHMVIDANGRECNCGNVGCLEAMASGTAVARDARQRLEGGARSSLIELAGGEPANITAEMVGLAAKRGDAVALDVVRRAGGYLGVGLANLVNILKPEVIIVGGGLSKMGGLLLDPARQVVQERAFRLPAQAVRIVTAQLGDDAGIIGAAALAREAEPWRG